MRNPWDNIRPAPLDDPVYTDPLQVFTVGSPGSIKFSLADMVGETPPDMVEIPLVDEDVD